MMSFKELREKAGMGPVVKKFTAGRSKVTITKNGNKFAAHIGSELLGDDFPSEKEAEKSAKDFVKLMREEYHI